MKRIIYLFTFIAAAMAFASCNPLDNTYKELDQNPTPNVKTLNYTLVASDYSLLASSTSGYKNKAFTSTADANASIPTILNSRFRTLTDGSIANITYTSSPVTIKLADSTFNNVSYTVTTADYNDKTGQAVTGTTFKDYSNAQVLLFLTWKYPTPVANQLVLLTYNYYESGVTPSAGVPTTDSFIYLNGAWTKAYTVSAAQYASVNRGNYGNFTTSDATILPSWFNTFLKNDPTVSSTAKAGDIKYVSFKYYNSGNFQRVIALTFDGTNWVTTPVTTTTLTFVRKNGTWIPDPTVYYSLASADYTYIAGLTFGSSAARSNLGQYKNFNITANGTTTWSDDDITQALAALLKSKYPSPTEGQIFKVTYYVYNSGAYSYPVKTYVYTGGTFVIQK